MASNGRRDAIQAGHTPRHTLPPLHPHTEQGIKQWLMRTLDPQHADDEQLRVNACLLPRLNEGAPCESHSRVRVTHTHRNGCTGQCVRAVLGG